MAFYQNFPRFSGILLQIRRKKSWTEEEAPPQIKRDSTEFLPRVERRRKNVIEAKECPNAWLLPLKVQEEVIFKNKNKINNLQLFEGI